MTDPEMSQAVLEFVREWVWVPLIAIGAWLFKLGGRVNTIEADLTAIRDGIKLRNEMHDDQRNEDRARQKEDRDEFRKGLARMENMLRDGLARLEAIARSRD